MQGQSTLSSLLKEPHIFPFQLCSLTVDINSTAGSNKNHLTEMFVSYKWSPLLAVQKVNLCSTFQQVLVVGVPQPFCWWFTLSSIQRCISASSHFKGTRFLQNVRKQTRWHFPEVMNLGQEDRDSCAADYAPSVTHTHAKWCINTCIFNSACFFLFLLCI
jgi:hypothetical protein